MRRVVACLATILLVTTGCFASKETREGASRLDDALGTPSWAESVDVETGVAGVSDDVVETIVVLNDSAEAGEIADFVLDHPDQVAEAGLGLGFADLRFETSEGAVLTVPYAEPTDDAGVRSAVERWLAVHPLLGSGSTAELSRSTGGSSYVASLADGGAQAVADLFDRLRSSDELTAPADAWSVSTDVDGLAMSLASYTLPTKADVTGWVALVDAVDLLPPRFEATGLSMQRYDPHAGVDLMILMPDDVTRENITPARYGDQLWPALQAQLRTMAGLRGGWSYLVQWAPQDLPEYTTIMLSLLDDKEPIDNHDPSSLWAKQAREYVDGL